MAPAPQADSTARSLAAAAAAVDEALQQAGVDYERPRPESFLVTLPGQRKRKTLVWLEVGLHSMLVRSFFCKRPDENGAAFYQWLLGKNLGMYGLAFGTDELGDVYLSGRVAAHSITGAEVDRLLGCVVSYTDDYFNTALELGFASAIRREWAWRESRGDSLRNLAAFRHLVAEEAHREGGGPPARGGADPVS